MKVRIDKSVFVEAIDDMRQIELSFLLNIIIYKKRYELKVTDSEVLKSDSYGRLPQTEKEIIEQAITDTIRSSSFDSDCEVAVDGETEYELKKFSPSEAIVYLLQPLSIILENGLNDSYLMKVIFHLFDQTGELTSRMNEGWIRFENAGGCSNVKNFLKARINSYGNKLKFLNCYVLLDGDRRYPTDPEPNKKYKKLKEQLDEWGVCYHVLEKRSMENYMPDEAIDSFETAETRAWIMAYLSLTPEQKDHFSIAEGFTKDLNKFQKERVKQRESLLSTKDINRRKKSYVRCYLHIDEQAFYGSVSKGNFLHLEKGLKVKDFKVRYPEKFNDSVVVYRKNMLKRTIHQKDPLELEHIAESVRNLI